MATMAISSRRVQRALPRLDCETKGHGSVLLASFCNVDKRVVTLFQVRYYTGEELKVLFGIAREPLTIKRDFSEFDLHGDWRKRLTKKYNTNDTRRKIEFLTARLRMARR